MASASLIATAFALIMLIITAYFLVGVVLTTAQVVSYAQTDQVNQQELRMRTSLSINTADISSGNLTLDIENTGSTIIEDFEYIDMYTVNSSTNPPIYYPMGEGSWVIVSIIPDIINPGLLDPDEVMQVNITYTGDEPVWAKMATPNGISVSAYI
jgi:flagellar protein FlaF